MNDIRAIKQTLDVYARRCDDDPAKLNLCWRKKKTCCLLMQDVFVCSKYNLWLRE